MITRVSKWGHSLAVRLPRRLASASGLEEGAAIEITRLDNGSIELRPAGPTLKELVGRITPENRHREIDSGNPTGREAW